MLNDRSLDRTLTVTPSIRSKSDGSGFTVSQFYGGRDKRNRKAKCKSAVTEYRIPKCYYPGFSGPSICWETFYRQQEAFEYVDKNSESKLAVFAFESSTGSENCSKASGGGRRYLVSSLTQFWHHYRNLHSNQRHHYEVIREGCRCKLYFDLEFTTELNKNRNGDAMVDTLIKYVCLWLKEYFGVDCNRSHVLDLDSSTAAKFSRHLIFQTGSAVFENATVAGYFVRHIFALLVQYLNLKTRKERATTSTADVESVMCRSHLRERSTNKQKSLRTDKTGGTDNNAENRIALDARILHLSSPVDKCEVGEMKLSGAECDENIQDVSPLDSVLHGSPRKKVKRYSNKEVDRSKQRKEKASVLDDVIKSFEESSDEEEHSFLTGSYSTGSKSLDSSTESCPGSNGLTASHTIGWDDDDDEELALERALLEQEIQSDKIAQDFQCASICVWDSDLDEEYENTAFSGENCANSQNISSCDFELDDFDNEMYLTDLINYSDGTAGSKNSHTMIETDFSLDSNDDLYLNSVTQDYEQLVKCNSESKCLNKECHHSSVDEGYNARNERSECSTLVDNKYDTVSAASNCVRGDEGISLEEWSQIKELYEMKLLSDDEDDNDCDANLLFMKRLEGQMASGSVFDDAMERICGQFSLDELKSLLVKDKNGRDTTFCDLGVYTKNRNFRLYLSSKVNKNRPLVLSEHNQYHPPKVKNKRQPFSEEREHEGIFMASLISVFRPNETTLILQFGSNTHHSDTLSKDSGGGARFLTTSLAPTVDSNSVQVTGSPFADLDRFISSLVSGGDKNGKIRAVKCNFERNTITYNISGYRWCRNIGRQHRSNNIFFTVDIESGTYIQGCYDVDCAHGLRTVEKIPDSIKLDAMETQ